MKKTINKSELVYSGKSRQGEITSILDNGDKKPRPEGRELLYQTGSGKHSFLKSEERRMQLKERSSKRSHSINSQVAQANFIVNKMHTIGLNLPYED